MLRSLKLMRIAYLTSLYPAPSHTFIRREVVAVREHGVDVKTFSVRTPSAEERGGPADPHAHAHTSYLLPMNPVRAARAHVGQALRDPLAYARTFGLALKHRVPGVKALGLAMAHFVEAIVLVDELQEQ